MVDVGWPAIDAVIDGLLVPVVVTEAAVPLSLLSDFVTEVSLSLAVVIAVPEVDVEPTFPLELESIAAVLPTAIPLKKQFRSS